MASTLAFKKKRKYGDIQVQAKVHESVIFTDTEFWVDNKTYFQWNTPFQAFQSKQFQVLLQDDPSAVLGKEIYQNKIWTLQSCS